MPVLKPLGEHELFLFFVQFTLLLLIARTMGELAVRVKLPSVVGELLGGFVIGPSLLGAIAPGLFETIFPGRPRPVPSARDRLVARRGHAADPHRPRDRHRPDRQEGQGGGRHLARRRGRPVRRRHHRGFPPARLLPRFA